MIRDHDTIAAPATAAGGALAVIRISGEEALRICDRIFRGRKPLAAAAGYTVHYGEIVDDGRVLDDVLVTVFRAPRSYTGEDAAEHCRSGKEGRQFSLENVFHGDSSLKLEIDEFLRVESGAVRAADGRHCQQDNPDRVPEPDGLQQLFPQRKTAGRLRYHPLH